MSESRPTRRFPASLTSSRPAFAALAVAAWVALEFALRRGLVPHLADVVGTGRGADAVVLALGFPLTAGLVAWAGIRAGIEPADWDYEVSLRSVGAGVGGLVAYVVVLGAAAVLSSVLGVETGTAAVEDLGVADAPTWALVVLLVGNGIVVPVTEELAWRGVIQTALAESYGTAIAVGVTAVAFVAKHLVVDLAAAPLRVTSLAVAALVLCGLRARYGTASSTVAHLGTNLLATASLVLTVA